MYFQEKETTENFLRGNPLHGTSVFLLTKNIHMDEVIANPIETGIKITHMKDHHQAWTFSEDGTMEIYIGFKRFGKAAKNNDIFKK